MLFLALSLSWPLEPLLYTPCIHFFIYDISLYLSKKKKYDVLCMLDIENGYDHLKWKFFL